jgi:hypothetical protein
MIRPNSRGGISGGSYARWGCADVVRRVLIGLYQAGPWIAFDGNAHLG